MYLHSNCLIGGAKAGLVQRILKFEVSKANPNTLSSRIEAYLGTPCTVQPGIQPDITAHYRSTFNATDRFDTYLGHIKFQHHHSSLHQLCFISSIRMALVNTYSTYHTHLAIQQEKGPEGIKPFTRNIAQRLLQE